MVDDSSRHKYVRFLTAKSEALSECRQIIAEIEASQNIGRPEPLRITGHFHSDNAGEYLSARRPLLSNQCSNCSAISKTNLSNRGVQGLTFGTVALNTCSASALLHMRSVADSAPRRVPLALSELRRPRRRRHRQQLWRRRSAEAAVRLARPPALAPWRALAQDSA